MAMQKLAYNPPGLKLKDGQIGLIIIYILQERILIMRRQKKGEGETSKLVVPTLFTYEFYESNRYQISEKDGYECLCNNGFIKLYTLKTRVYWHAQNQFQHRVPDWKFHVSVQHEDLKKAWDIIVGIFLKMKCRAGMKVVYLKQAVNPQVGREITIYIVKYSKQFDKSSFAGDYQVSIADEHSEDFWKEMVIEIEHALWVHEIKPNGLANGDLKIGQYVSLRNEAFVLNEEDGNYMYPPNFKGWNPEGQRLPFDISRFIKQIRVAENGFKAQEKQKISSRPMYYFSLPIMFLTLGYLLVKKLHGY